MRPVSEPGPASGLTPLLRGVVAGLARASGADLVTLFLYDEEARGFFAPAAAGLPEDGLRESLEDMRQQLSRYRADVAQGKVPEELRVQQYGSTVWLTITRRPLVARDAHAEIDSTFVRRHRVESLIGLPLLAGGRLLGIVYLDYQKAAGDAPGSRLPDAEGLAGLEREAAAAAAAIQAALASAERAALEGLGRLTSLLTAPAEVAAGPAELRRGLSIALADLLLASDLDAAAVYELAPRRGRLELVTAHAPAAAPARVPVGSDPAAWPAGLERAVATAMDEAELRPLATFPLGPAREPHGYLLVLSRDPLAAERQAPAVEVLLRAAAELIGGALAARRLIGELEGTGRLLGALGDMTSAMLRPGSSRQEVLEAVVAHLTDAAVPEFDYHFATVYLLGEGPGGAMSVRMAAGATTSEAIAATPGDGPPGRRRVPRWALDRERALDPRDVLTYVAGTRQVAVVGPAPRPEAPGSADVVDGAIPERATWYSASVIRPGGEVVTVVPACLIGEPAGVPAGPDGEAPFTLAGDVFEASGHADLIRLFVPFELGTEERAGGVLEVGYHRSSERRPDWEQIEALRAAAAQVAVAVETARLYEETRHHAEQLELSADVSEAIASSIDLDQTLRLVARNLVRLVDASLCQIALYEEDGEAWYGAAASDQEEKWQRWHGERTQPSFLFELLDRGEPLLVEDVQAGELVEAAYAAAFGVRSLLALPLVADGQPIGAAVLAEVGEPRSFTAEEVQRAQGLAHQAAVAIKNARLHALAEEERHIQKDFLLIGFGQWGQRAYQHLQVLKQFDNFRIHVVERDVPGARERLAEVEREVLANGDTLVWDSPSTPARDQLQRELESSCYVVTYVATPAATHLPTLERYHDLSDVVLVEKPLGASPEAYREFLDRAPGGVELVAADHYYFKLEVRLLQALLTEERTLRAFLDSVDEVRIEILEAQPLAGAAAEIGVVADLVPHAFAIISLLTPIDRIGLDPASPLQVARHDSPASGRESYARILGSFHHQGRLVRLVIDVGKGVEDAKWIRLSGERRLSGRSPFYKFDFGRGEAIDGTQSTVRAAVRRIREPGVPDNAHLTMLRHVIEKRHPGVGILSIREAIRANQRLQQLEALAGELLERGECATYALGTRPAFAGGPAPGEAAAEAARATPLERARARG